MYIKVVIHKGCNIPNYLSIFNHLLFLCIYLKFIFHALVFVLEVIVYFQHQFLWSFSLKAIAVSTFSVTFFRSCSVFTTRGLYTNTWCQPHCGTGRDHQVWLHHVQRRSGLRPWDRLLHGTCRRDVLILCSVSITPVKHLNNFVTNFFKLFFLL